MRSALCFLWFSSVSVQPETALLVSNLNDLLRDYAANFAGKSLRAPQGRSNPGSRL
jgi:hypothetical protein